MYSCFSFSFPFSKTHFLLLGRSNENPMFEVKCVAMNGTAERKEARIPNPKKKPEEIFMVISKKRVAMLIIKIVFRYPALLFRYPPRNPATPPARTCIMDQGPCPPKIKKFDKYQELAPITAPFLQPNNDPASKAKKVIGSTLGNPCITILPSTPPITKVISMRASSN